MNNIKLEWKHGDWAAYFGSMASSLASLLTMMGSLIFIVGIPTEIVHERTTSASGLVTLTVSACYSWSGL